MSNAQAEFEQRFHSAVEKRASAREKLRDVTASIARLKADAAQANADVATTRADAKAAGVKLPKITQPSAPAAGAAVASEMTNGASAYAHEGGPGPEDDEG